MKEQELDELLRQKHEIEQKIKAVKNSWFVQCGTVKIDKEKYPTSLPDRWYLAVSVENKWFKKDHAKTKRWRAVLQSDSRDDVIEAIPQLIRDLTDLYNQEKSGGNDA